MSIILITGSGRKGNLGFETAKQLGEQGHHVILAARRENELAALPDNGPTGGFFRDGKELPW